MFLAFSVTALIAALNNLLHLAPRPFREHLVTTGVALAGTGGVVWLLFHHRQTLLSQSPTTLAIGALAVAIGIGAVVVLRRRPAWATRLHDSRIAGMTRRSFAVHTFIRIPAVSGFAEEVLFRGVVWALIESIAGTTAALVGSAVAFGLWHVVVSAHQARRVEAPIAGWVVGSVLSTFAAGLGFGLLRLVTGGVWAPAIVHAVINMVGSLGARMAADAGALRRAPAVGRA